MFFCQRERQLFGEEYLLLTILFFEKLFHSYYIFFTIQRE
jgi:hypothetical protein